MLRDYFRYDKRIRKVFYKYIELYEENLKSIFYDKTIWENNLFVLSPDLKNYSSIYEINKTDKNYYSLGRLKDILFIMKLIDEQKVQEIDRVIDLRNNIAHYNLLVLHLDELQDLIAGFLTSMTKQIKRQVLQDLDDCKLGLVDLKNLYLKIIHTLSIGGNYMLLKKLQNLENTKLKKFYLLKNLMQKLLQLTKVC
ncbi:hypothetical protein [Spiroplasma clarkii]|uniref:hypothetical protein n=1 Tax=Spiroplasma clarkii TaxID=2139 RepID=UPI0011BADCAB|nr:hypothetical protein [Spiroplasma clarkii]